MFRRPTVALMMLALLATGSSVLGQAKNAAKPAEPPPKPDPVVIKLTSSQKQKVMGEEVHVVAGTDPLTGKPRQFAVKNQEPQNRNDPKKYDPAPRVMEAVNATKPGDYIKIEIAVPTGGRWGGGGYVNNNPNSAVPVWIDRAEVYKPEENEAEPGVFILRSAYQDTVEKTDVFVAELIKWGKIYDAYIQMVPDPSDPKKMVPDPALVKAVQGFDEQRREAEKAKKKFTVEATLQAAGPKAMFLTAVDAYAAPKTATFMKISDADVNGQKGHAIELSESGSTVTLLVPGKLSGKRWVSDAGLVADAKRLKSGTAVTYKSRDVEGKQFVRQLLPAPKAESKADAK